MRLPDKIGWKIGTVFHAICAVRAIQFELAEQRRRNRRHFLNLTKPRRGSSLPRIFRRTK